MDAIFKALNDPARRTLLDRLRQKDGQTLTDLEAALDMTRFGVMKHLKVLEEASLITTKKVGRFKYHYLNAVPLQEVIDRWIEPLLAKPVARGMVDLKKHLEKDMPYDTADKPDFVHQTFIRCTQDALWNALTRADQVAAYHFMCDTVEGDANVGNTMVMKRKDGSIMLSQTTTHLDPKSRIEMTFEPNWPDNSNEISEIVFIIQPEGEHCKLTCEHYRLPADQQGAAEGWARHIASLKSWLETGAPIKVSMP